MRRPCSTRRSGYRQSRGGSHPGLRRLAVAASRVALEPPFEPYDRYAVTGWDCFINGWDAGWESSRIRRLLPAEAIDVWGELTLPADIDQLTATTRRLSVARFPEDEATLAKAEQLLRSLPHLTQPISFEIVGLGPMPEYDSAKMQQLIEGHLKGQTWEYPLGHLRLEAAPNRDAIRGCPSGCPPAGTIAVGALSQLGRGAGGNQFG